MRQGYCSSRQSSDNGSGDQICSGAPHPPFRPAKDSMDAAGELGLPLPCPESKRYAAAKQGVLGKTGEAGGIGFSGRGGVQHTIVARELPLDAQAALDPVEHGIKREENQADLLDEIRPVIAAAKMLHLMEHDLLELLFGESLEQLGGKKNPGMEESGDAGPVDLNRGAELRPALFLIRKGGQSGPVEDGSGVPCNSSELKSAADEPNRPYQG